MQTRKRVLAQFVPNPLSSAQEQKILGKILEKNESRSQRLARSPSWGAVGLAATLLLIVGISWHFAGSNTHSDEPLIAAETSAARWYATGDERLVVVLQGGRRLELKSLTQLNVLDEKGSRARLERGTVRCEAGKERLTLEAGNVEVYCEGESVSAELGIGSSGPHLTVTALSGPVTLSYEGKTHTVAPGSPWSTREAEVEPPKAVAPSPPVAAEVEPPVAKLPVAPPVSKKDAEELWKMAQDARFAGDAQEAARSFSRLMTEYPGDSRAGLAAFELGRIQLDSLGDPSGALRAFDFALQRGRGGFFVADAAAGRVTALDRMGAQGACEKARDSFLTHHAASPQASRVRSLCTRQ